ncbi:hypothetical protein ROHU_004329 [Labeo rohita]|uniref:Uncharacterized protein n=1 Tax=Labeo rohita TaxID=84645 RepID=A0A498NMX2_LABRO|nr:hypothetical protein ROHU_004329 [Labeo rohita]
MLGPPALSPEATEMKEPLPKVLTSSSCSSSEDDSSSSSQEKKSCRNIELDESMQTFALVAEKASGSSLAADWTMVFG